MNPARLEGVPFIFSGRLADGRGWVFRGSKVDDYKHLLPQVIQDKLAGLDPTVNGQELKNYYAKQKLIFIGNTTHAKNFYGTQLTDSSLNDFQRFAKAWTLGWGFHNEIKREWFEIEINGVKINPQQLIEGQPDTGLAQYRVIDTHLTDIYADETRGFLFWHNKEGANVFLSGFVEHLVSDVPTYLFKKLTGRDNQT